MFDRSDLPAPGKLLGVCARVAAASELPAWPFRLLAVLALLCAFKLTVVAYCVAALAIRLERR